jgi:hypothetical protein
MKLKSMVVAAVTALCGLTAAAAPAVAGGGSGPAGATPRLAAAAAPYCGITWGSTDKEAGALGIASLVTTRTGPQDCYDRVVFELDGPLSGYRVRYGEAYTGGGGVAMSPFTAGGALLAVTLLSPGQTYPARTGDHTANLFNYRTLRDVVYAGSYEGYTDFAVGVRARLPFRVLMLDGPGTHSRIVLDIAHQW